MKRILAAAWLSLAACGLPTATDPATDPTTKAAVGRQVNSLTQAIVDRDAKALAQLMSRSLLAAARAQGGDLDSSILEAFEPQRAGLVAQFAHDGRVEPFTVDQVALEAGGGLAVTLSTSTQTLSRPVHFIFEDGEYRFAGANPEEPHGVDSASSSLRQGLNTYPYWWSFGNGYSEYKEGNCGNELPIGPSDPIPGTYFLIPSHGSTLAVCPSFQCTWFGSTCTYFWKNPRACHYQVFGPLDGWYMPDGTFFCFR